MTIPFGRHRLSITLTRATDPRAAWEAMVPVGMTDRELARLSRRCAIDPVQARWNALAMIYGGIRRP